MLTQKHDTETHTRTHTQIHTHTRMLSVRTHSPTQLALAHTHAMRAHRHKLGTKTLASVDARSRCLAVRDSSPIDSVGGGGMKRGLTTDVLSTEAR